ncbi:hypothetical protein pb186bvf_016375 [Paramecium bursaria]
MRSNIVFNLLQPQIIYSFDDVLVQFQIILDSLEIYIQ